MRAIYEEKVRRGEHVDDCALYGPPVPEAFVYLRRWLYELHGRSGVGMNGFAPLSYATIAYWADLTGQIVEPFEVEALLMLDGILLHPDTRTMKAAPVASVTPPKRAWPSKKSHDANASPFSAAPGA